MRRFYSFGEIMIRTKDPFNSSNREFMTNISFWFYTWRQTDFSFKLLDNKKTKRETNFCISFNCKFLSHLLYKLNFDYHFHKIQSKIFHNMVSDWVKPIYKWSQIAFKKKTIFPIFADGLKLIKMFFFKMQFVTTSK